MSHILRLDIDQTRFFEMLDHVLDNSPGEEENQLGEAQNRTSYEDEFK